MSKRILFSLVLVIMLILSSGCIGSSNPKEETLIDETRDIKGGQYWLNCWEFKYSPHLKISVEVLKGSAIDFLAMDEREYYMNFKEKKPFQVYTKPSGEQIRQQNIEWYAPEGNICFIVSNIKNHETATVKIKIVEISD